jgi:hypothetical protein
MTLDQQDSSVKTWTWSCLQLARCMFTLPYAEALTFANRESRIRDLQLKRG